MPQSDGATLLAAHSARDAATLVRFYRDKANELEADGQVDAACFFLTQAYVWALEMGHAETNALHARLKAYGREE